MKFTELLKKKTADNPGTKAPVIAFLGDSVTQGVFEVYQKGGEMKVEFDSACAYPERVKELLAMMYPSAPVSVVNAGVNGGSAPLGLEVLRRDILRIKPDLLVACFGLNDSNKVEPGLETYRTALGEIFDEAAAAGIECIFMTPNMMNTDSSRVSPGSILEELAVIFAERQKNGLFDSYIDAARAVCAEKHVPVCDCYAIWKKLYENGADTTGLLANGLNHPLRKMHELFAWQLVLTIMNN